MVLILIRLALPYILLHYINKSLSNLDGYSGHVGDLELSLHRGAYIVRNITIRKDESAKTPVVSFKADNIDLSVSMKALFHRHIVGQITLNSPEIVFMKTEPAAKKDTTSFQTIVKNFMPLRINRIEINNGSMHYLDPTTKPKVDVSVDQTHILVLNLTNIDTVSPLPSTITAQANIYQGNFNLKMKLDPLAKNPRFDLNAELKKTNLVKLNDFLKAYGNFTVNKGSFSLYTEMAAQDGKFTGYVKPLIEDLDVLGPEDRHESFIQKAWESIVGTVGAVFKNQKKDQLASKIPIEGSFKNPKTKTMYAVGEVLRNAFIQALMPSIDNEINFSSVKGVKSGPLQKMYSEPAKSEKAKSEKKKDKK